MQPQDELSTYQPVYAQYQTKWLSSLGVEKKVKKRKKEKEEKEKKKKKQT